jgi:hypothetical protein
MPIETVARPPAASWAERAGWIAGMLANSRFDSEVFWQALMCGWRAALGGFVGGIAGLGAAMALTTSGQAGLRFVGASLLLSLIATGVVMGFLHGRDVVIGRPTFNASRWFFVILAAAMIGASAAVAAMVFGALVGTGMPHQYYGEPLSHGVRLKSFGGVLSWWVLALGIVTVLGRAVPNVTLGPRVFSAILAGGLSWLAVTGFQDERMGLLFGVMLLGLLTAILLTIAEAASREWFIEYPGGQGRLARINLGSVPVLAGTDPASCHVVRSGASIPVSLKYWIESGQPFVMDCVAPQTYRISTGDRRTLSGTVISVKSLVPGGSRSAAGTASASPGMAVVSTGGAGVSRPAVVRPGAISAPAAAPVAPAAGRPPPPLPPPRVGN